MSTKVDPLGETLVVDVSAFDPHAAVTVAHRVDFEAQTRDLSVVNREDPATEVATTFWVAPASIQATEVVAQQAEVAAKSPAVPRPSPGSRRGLVTALFVAVIASTIGGVIRARSGHASAPAVPSQSQVSAPSDSPAVNKAEAEPRSPSPAGVRGSASVQLTAEQVRTLEAEAASALFAGDEATALRNYQTLSAAGHEPAQRVLTLLERTP